MINNLNEVIEAFLQWFEKDPHKEREDQYPELKTIDHLSSLDKTDFIEYFFQFARHGGYIQSGGARTAGLFKNVIEKNYIEFREYILEPYRDNFNVDSWLNRISNFKYFGPGVATIYLNRIDKNRFIIVNNKSREALDLMGYKIKSDLIGGYQSIKIAQKDLLNQFPELDNFYKADSLNHFLIGTDDGEKFINDPIADLIRKYKAIKKSNGHSAEFYKYDAITHFHNNWNVNTSDFAAMLKEALKGQINLMYNLSPGTITSVAERFSDQTKSSFENLFDESTDLEKRIQTFSQKIDHLKKEIKPTDNGFQDERAISVYLTFMYPDKYTFYKYSYYSKYCKLLGIKEKPTGTKFIHYLELIEELKELYLQEDEELWTLTNENLPDTAWPDEELNILAQDILYVALDQNEDSAYWIFQGNPKFYDVAGSLRENVLKTWKVAAHKAKIKPDDKVILWVTGENSGCYALCKVVSEVEKRDDDPDEIKFYTEWNEDELTDKVEIEIEYNFWDQPVLKRDLLSLPEFSSFKGGYRGTNFEATKKQYDTIVKLSQKKERTLSNDEKSLIENLKRLGDKHLASNHFLNIDKLINATILDKNDKRLVCTTPKNSKFLTLIINQRYIIQSGNKSYRLIFPKSNEAWINDSEEVVDVVKFDPLSGESDAPLLVNFKNEAEISDVALFEWIIAAKKELDYGNSSSYSKHDNKAYREAIFDKVYRNKILQEAFANDMDRIEEKQESYNTNKVDLPQNLILFGPPGTGKTYQLTNKYIKYFIDETHGKSKGLFTYELVNELSWWEVIALSLYELKTAKVNEILKHPLMLEKLSQSNNKKPQNTIWYWLQNHTKDSCTNVNVVKKSDVQIFWKNEKSVWSIDKELTAEILPDLIEKLNAWQNFKPLNATVKRYEMITFHQSYSYEEFIEGIRPDMEEEGEMKYKLEPGIFLRIAEKARKDKDKPYAIFIDEINRGNISKIFGELITLIEPDKRQGQENELKVTLPYSKTKFSVPANLHIIGTMNTADRSIALIDTALRRRFHFKEMMPEPTLLTTTVEGINLQSLLEKINERIEFLLDRDHTIGHSYFIRIKNKNELCQAFRNKVIPLLQEYFYNDWEKIQLVLGDNKSWGKTEEQQFVKVKKHYTVNAEKDLFGFDVEDYEDEMIYEINPSLKNDEFDQIPIKAFKYIYEKPEKEKQL